MDTIFEYQTRKSIINRILLLKETDLPQWGKMNVNQMLLHCVRYENMMQGKVKYKRLLIGYLFGKSALKVDFLKDDSPIKKNTPTLKQLKIKTSLVDFSLVKEEWMRKIEDYDKLESLQIVHPFFGKLTMEQIGALVFKHADHHLRQFKR